MASKPIYQFYVELDDYSPKIWRRFQVFRDISMARLGYIVMTLFEMRASHLFNLEVDIEKNMQRRLSKILSPEELAEAFKDPIYMTSPYDLKCKMTLPKGLMMKRLTTQQSTK